MNGAESAMQTARQAGIEVCFANAGTTEMLLVGALDAVPGMRAVLCLFEGVCTGAADGYARMAGKPALTLLHLGPGLANGLANLHNARRARSAVVNLIGEHATWHRAYDAPLTSDIEPLARFASAWVRTSRVAVEVAGDMAAAIEASLSPPGQIATLIMPQDCSWDAATSAAPPRARSEPARVTADIIEAAAAALHTTGAALLLGGTGLGRSGLQAAARLAEVTGCPVWQEHLSARLEQGCNLPAFPRVPYFPEDGVEALKGVRTLVLAGAPEPVSFFSYPGMPSCFTPPGCTVLTLARPEEDVVHALEAVADAVGASSPVRVAPRRRVEHPTGALTPVSLGQALAALQPEGAIVVDEALTTRIAYQGFAPTALPHTVLSVPGGSIGLGLPCALGAALACPDRKVIAFEADGSGMYTVQALWSMAHEGLDVTVIICANRQYRILQVELARAGITAPGPAARSLTDLSPPSIDWVGVAAGLGVPAVRADSADTFVRALERALAGSGPSLVEAVL